MAMTFPVGRDAFGDPRTGEVVAWARNHNEEQSVARVRSIAHVQPTLGRWRPLAGVFEQAAQQDTVIKLAGRAPVEAQHRMFLRFLRLSLAQSIYFHHFAGEGNTFVCQLTAYEPQRKYVSGPVAEHYVWDYTLQLDVINA